jgi:WD40 repeat protein
MSAITQLHQIDLHSGHITKPRWSPNGRLLALPTESGSIAVFDLSTGQVAQTLGSHSAEVTSVCWDRESELIMTGSLDRSVGVWELKSGNRAPYAPGGHKEPVHSVEWTDEGAYAMTCSADRVRAWDGFCLQAGWTKEMEEAANKNTGFTAAACSFQTTLLLAMAAGNGSLLLLASLVSADLLDSVRVTNPIQCLAWSPTQDLLAAGTSQGILAFHTTQTGFEGSARELTGSTTVHALAFSGNGKLLASQDAEGLKIWDVKSAKVISTVHDNLEPLSQSRLPSGLAFHPKKPLLALVMANGYEFCILELGNMV